MEKHIAHPTRHPSGQTTEQKTSTAVAVGHLVTVNDGDRNDSEKNEGRLCQNCDDAGTEGEGEQEDDTGAARNYDNDDDTGEEAAREDGGGGGGAYESCPNERMEVDTDNPGNLEPATAGSAGDHGGIIGELRMTE